MTYKYIVTFLFLCSVEIGLSKELKIIDMEGTYDLDGDGQYEFAALEYNRLNGHTISMIRYYEIDIDGYQNLSWELEMPDGLLGSFIGVKLADIIGDGTPELVAVANLSSNGDETILQPIIFYYKWYDDGFSETPSGYLNIGDQNDFVRCHNFDLIDLDNNNDQEILLSLGSPMRALALIDVSSEGDLIMIERLEPTALSTGVGFVYGKSIDWNNDGYDEIISFSPEGNVLKIQPYFNRNGKLVLGEAKQEIITGINGLLPMSIIVSDWDSDGFKDILLPFQSGHVVAMTLSPATVAIDVLPIDAGPLSDMSVVDINLDNVNDLFLVSGEMNMITMAIGSLDTVGLKTSYFTLETDTADAQVFNIIPITEKGVYTGSIVASSWNGQESNVFLTEIGKIKIDIPSPDEEDVITALDEQIDLIDLFPEIKHAMDLPKLPKPPATTGQMLPKDILPRHILTENQLFTYKIPEDAARQFYSFRWLTPPPKGMFFHYESRSIQWVPDDTQLGAYKLGYRVEMKIGESVSLEATIKDSLLTYQMIPELEGDDEYLWIYVNDPPKFVTKPVLTEFVANSTFAYSPVVIDRNIDKNIRYFLEFAPDDMILGENGSLVWKTDSADVNVYDVRLIATDGFDRDIQEFKLYARAGVKIISRPLVDLKVNEPYQYQVDVWRPELSQEIKVKLLHAPIGMLINKNNFISWTPETTQLDTQYFAIEASHGVAKDTQNVAVFVNHPPIISSAPPLINVVNVGSTWDFQLEISDPNMADKLTITSLELPEGMRIDPFTWRLRWDPTDEELDFSHMRLEITDGKEIYFIDSDFYVNAPIKIVSVPPMTANLGEPYQYRILNSDKNKSALLPYDKTIRIDEINSVRIYSIDITDDVYQENIGRYIGEWESAEEIYLTDNDKPESSAFSRLNAKKYVNNIFWENERLYILIKTVDDRTIGIKDLLWEFFQGSKGKPPKVIVERLSPIKYTLLEFPDGMEVDEYSGIINWTPGPEQHDSHTIKLLVSDGYMKDEQAYEIYVNHKPVIVSNAPKSALVDEVYRYQIQVEDKNSNSELVYELLKTPQGMQMTEDGKVVWIPRAAQINNHLFTVRVTDGYSEDVQKSQVFVNIPPSIISIPKPVALTGYEYTYKLVAEDLNKDKIKFKPIKLPKYSTFNKRTGLIQWRPRNNQLGPNDVIIAAIDERGATTAHEFKIHAFENPSARQFVNTGWPLMLTFVGMMFAWGVAQI